MQLGYDWTVVNISPHREHCFLHTESVLSVNVELGIGVCQGLEADISHTLSSHFPGMMAPI